MTMIGVIVSFDYDGDFDRERVVGIAQKSAAKFEGMPGLRLKVFTVDDDRRRALNLYLWDSEAAARSFFTEELTGLVTEMYGVRPRIEFVEIAALVDNARAGAAA
jgi:hypothetical protein